MSQTDLIGNVKDFVDCSKDKPNFRSLMAKNSREQQQSHKSDKRSSMPLVSQDSNNLDQFMSLIQETQSLETLKRQGLLS